jgi:hypothetical protein
MALRGEPKALGGAGRERLVYSPAAGTFRTNARIGDRVHVTVDPARTHLFDSAGARLTASPARATA